MEFGTKHSCDWCDYFYEILEPDTPGGAVGWCACYPPTPMVVDGKVRSVRPVVRADAHCRFFKARY